MRFALRRLMLVWCLGGLCAMCRAAEPTSEQLEFFEKRVRPVLVAHCGECHSGGQSKGGLDLASGVAALRGGDSGAAIVPGKSGESLLIEAITHLGDIKMPPKAKLADEQIADLRKWVELGAPWPADSPGVKSADSAFVITPEQRAFWSFQAIRVVSPPTVRDPDWPAGPLDQFIVAGLDVAGLRPSREADKRTLIRRVTFDLLGLPPTPAEIEDFVADESPQAWERVVDRLLASPQYGERWGRHWLDVARYAEDQAHTFQARLYPAGYRYRDWVVRALNTDLPYDQFVREQIAGDLLEGPIDDRHEREIALGYFALGPVYYGDAGCGSKAALDELDDRLDTLARGFLGLTIACARCHDHKFDPISQRDYYALAGVFRSTAYRELPLVAPETVAQYDQGQKQIRDQEQAVRKYLDGEALRLGNAAARKTSNYLVAVWRLNHPSATASPVSGEVLAKELGLNDTILERWQKYLVPHNRERLPSLRPWYEASDLPASTAGTRAAEVPAEVVAAADAFEKLVFEVLQLLEEERRKQEANPAEGEVQKRRGIGANLPKPQAEVAAAVLGPRGICGIPTEKLEKYLDEPHLAELKAARQQLETVKKAAPPKYEFAHALKDGEAANMKLHIRGNPQRTGDEVPRRFLEILSPGEPAAFSQGSGRLELARAIASANNPLTARVIVNRVWQHHFGRGIVATPSNFGALGERPSHPELLDYLAGQLIAQGWSLKALHREILLSATYRQSSDDDARGFEIDSDNKLLWRMNRRRLDVESWRDALLAVAGNLDETVGGPSGNLATADFRRRTLYGAVSRHSLDGLLRLFDFPDPNISSERRTVTTVPLQQLFVLNSDFMAGQARALARRANSVPCVGDVPRIEQMYHWLFGRSPTSDELKFGLEFLLEPDAGASAGPTDRTSALSRWEQYAQVLLGANEFTFVD